MRTSSVLTAHADPDIDLRARIDALNDEAWAVRFTDRDRAEKLAREALELAEVAEYPVGVALALRTLGAQLYYLRSDYDGALELLQRALVLLDEVGTTRGRADVLNGIGYIQVRNGEHAAGVRLHLQALELQRATDDLSGQASSLMHLGNAAFLTSDYGRSLEYHEASLALRERIGEQTSVAYSLANIGTIYYQQEDYERVLEYLGRALSIHSICGDVQAASVCLMNIGNAYAHSGEYDRALDYLHRASDSILSRGDHADRAFCLRAIGEVHEQRGDALKAFSYYRQSLELSRRLGIRIYEPETMVRLGALLVRQGDVEVGLAQLHEALRVAEAQNARQYVYEAHEVLANAYEAMGDAVRALEHHRSFHAVWREVFGTETNLRIQNARVREEVRQSEREAEILRERNEALTRADEEKARLLEQLHIQAAELERQTREDALTGVSNRRHLDDLLAVEWERALRFGRALSVAMVDVDHFKQVNDRFSHAAGDQVLRVIAGILREHVRGVDVVARYGGEEFCLVLVETGIGDAAGLCERLRALVQAHDWTSIHSDLAVTVSVGVAELEAGVESPAALLAAADARLYAAKHAGRNRVRAG